MKKFTAFLPALVFLIFLAVMTVLLVASPTKDYSENEKRNLAGRPEVTASAVLDGSAQEDLETFAADQIPGRDFFVGVNAYWSLATGRNTAQDIYYGKDGYLINAPKEGDETVFQNNLTRFQDFAAQLGVPADLIMIPSTGYVMADKLPAFAGTYDDDTWYDKAQETLTTLNLVDVRQTLKDGAKEGQVCYRTDHHITAFGSYLMNRAYQQAVGGNCPEQGDYTVTSYDGFYGTTWSGSGYWMVAPDQVETWDSGAKVTVTIQDGSAQPQVYDSLFFPSHLENLDKYPVYLDGNHGFVTIENPEAEGGTLLVIRDSYAHCLSTFLAGEYKTIYLVDLRYYRSVLSDFVAEHPVDRVLYYYGLENMVSDTNSAWLQ
jgi:hypothetical protein